MAKITDYLSLQQVADAIGVSKCRIAQFRRGGRLPAVMIAGRWYVHPRDVAALKATPRVRGRPKEATRGD